MRSARAAGRRLVLLALVALAGPSACSEASPEGEELASPAQRDATPVGEKGLARSEAERKEERLEEFGVAEPESGEAAE